MTIDEKRKNMDLFGGMLRWRERQKGRIALNKIELDTFLKPGSQTHREHLILKK